MLIQSFLNDVFVLLAGLWSLEIISGFDLDKDV